jgi:hypothetical protein
MPLLNEKKGIGNVGKRKCIAISLEKDILLNDISILLEESILFDDI